MTDRADVLSSIQEARLLNRIESVYSKAADGWLRDNLPVFSKIQSIDLSDPESEQKYLNILSSRWFEQSFSDAMVKAGKESISMIAEIMSTIDDINRNGV